MLFPENLTKTYENQQMVLGMLIHTADISNPAKTPEVYKKWVDLVFQEFFNQGDVEKAKGLPVSLLCDRETTNLGKSQIGFINFIVSPTFEVVLNIIPEVMQYYDTVKNNLKMYENILLEESKNQK
jgi:hypothetical protein